MRNEAAVKSGDLGRKPSENPKATHLGIRIDAETTAKLDAELARLKKLHPGLELTRSDIVRMLITEAFESRTHKRSK